MEALRVCPLTPELAPLWAELFVASSCSCFCRYWHFGGTKNDWLERLASSPDDNRAEQCERLAAGDDAARGLVAISDSVAVGWMKLVPRATVPKLRRLPVYRTHDLGPDEGVYSVACFLVHPAHRCRGVARALLEAAATIATEWGASAIEAYPHRRAEALRDEEVWMGPVSLFESCGFRVVAGEGPYPVLRKTLPSRAATRRSG